MFQLFSREVKPEEWQRFALYTRRVRALHFETLYEEAIHSTVWTYLHEFFLDAPMLPRLETLDIAGLSPRNLTPLTLLLAPGIQSLWIIFERGMTVTLHPSERPAGAAVLSAISRTCPGLHTLYLGHPFPVTMAGASILASLKELTKLVLCQCKWCPISDVKSLCTYPLAASLRVLKIAVKDIPASFSTDVLLVLDILSVQGPSEDINNFVRGIQPTALQKFTMMARRGYGDPPTPAHLESICDQLPSSLSSFKLIICEGRYGDPANNQKCELSAIVAQMRPLKNVTTLTLRGEWTAIIMDINGIRTLGELCPHLKSLTVTYTGIVPNHLANVTPLGLAEITRCCPALTYLSLSRLDASELLLSETDIPITSHGLQSLEFQEVQGTALPEPAVVARAVTRLFSRLKLDTTSDSDEGVCSGEWQGDWKHVRALLCTSMSD